MRYTFYITNQNTLTMSTFKQVKTLLFMLAVIPLMSQFIYGSQSDPAVVSWVLCSILLVIGSFALALYDDDEKYDLFGFLVFGGMIITGILIG